jgi:hypothetical protein
VRSTCSKICDELKDEVLEKYDTGIECDVSLETLKELLGKVILNENKNDNIVETTIQGGYIPYIAHSIDLGGGEEWSDPTDTTKEKK